MRAAFAIEFRCLCGHELGDAVTDTEGDTARVVVYHCESCGHDVALQLNLRDLGMAKADRSDRKQPTADERCGTERGWHAHRNRCEKACDPCRHAHSAATSEYRQRKAAAA